MSKQPAQPLQASASGKAGPPPAATLNHPGGGSNSSNGKKAGNQHLQLVPKPDMSRQWQTSKVDDEAFVVSLCDQLEVIKEQLDPLEAAKQLVRNQLGQVVARMGGRVEVENYGMLMITAPAHTVMYDRKGLDELVQQYIGSGQTEIAQAISKYRQASIKPGVLRITLSKD